MNYSVKYVNNFPYHDEVEEYWILFKPNYLKLRDFLRGMKEENKRIVIKFKEEDVFNFIENDEIKMLKAIDVDNFVICLPSYQSKLDMELFELLRQAEIPAFFKDSAFTMNILKGLIDMKVSDIYITSELGFNISFAAAMVHEANIRVRMYPNIVQASFLNDELTNFFIRPEDMYLYKDDVDIFEFWYDEDNDNLGEFYYKVYAINKKWFGDLSLLIYGLKQTVNNKAMLPIFGQYRYNCCQRCFTGSPCHLCNKLVSLANTMDENGLYIKPNI